MSTPTNSNCNFTKKRRQQNENSARMHSIERNNNILLSTHPLPLLTRRTESCLLTRICERSHSVTLRTPTPACTHPPYHTHSSAISTSVVFSNIYTLFATGAQSPPLLLLVRGTTRRWCAPPSASSRVLSRDALQAIPSASSTIGRRI